MKYTVVKHEAGQHGYIYIRLKREKLTYNEEWTTQRQWKHLAHKTHTKTTKAKHKRLKRRVTRTPPKPKGKRITTQLN
jgi:hypothetical protein